MSLHLDRTLKQNVRAAVSQDGTCEMAISSEAPYERWFGIEILSHDPGAVDLSRLADNSHPLLLNHCTDDQIGVLSDPVIGDDRMLRCTAKFSRSALGQEIMQDVNDGIRSLVSVGYLIDEIVEISESDDDMADYVVGGSRYKAVRTYSGDEFRSAMREQHGDDVFTRSGQAASRASGDEQCTYLVTKWTPFEASIVPIPADPNVGVGRSATVPAEPAAVSAAPEPAAQPAPVTHIIVETKTMSDVIQKSAAELDFERRSQIITAGKQFAKYATDDEIATACREGWTYERFAEFLMAKMANSHTNMAHLEIGMTKKEAQRFSIGRAVLAMATGDWRDAGFEREVSEAVGKITGQRSSGILLPAEILMSRDFNVGTSTEAGNLVATQLRTDLFTDVLRNKLVAGQLGVRILTGLTSTIDIPRKSVASTIGTVTEIGSASETNPNIQKVTLSPKRMSAYVETSLRAIQQAEMAVEPMLRDDLISGLLVQVENGWINGTGTDPQMLGLRNITGIGTTTAGANGGTVTWNNVVALESACANANAEPDRLAGYLFNTKQRGNMKTVQMGANLPFIWQNGDTPVNGYRAAITNNVPSNLTKGTSTTVCSAGFFSSDWSMSVIGFFGAPEVIVDPYSKADTGQVKITINGFADSNHRQPAALAKIEDLL